MKVFYIEILQLALHTHLQQLLTAKLFMLLFCWMVIGIMFQIITPLHKIQLEVVTVREVRGCICEICLVEVCLVSLMCKFKNIG